MAVYMKQDSDDILKRFMDALHAMREEVEEAYLFGSRCRSDFRPDSDYDILIVVKKKNREIISRLYDAVMDILLDSGRLVSLKIFTAGEFARLKSIPTPFMKNIMTEGIRLGING